MDGKDFEEEVKRAPGGTSRSEVRAGGWRCPAALDTRPSFSQDVRFSLHAKLYTYMHYCAHVCILTWCTFTAIYSGFLWVISLLGNYILIK